MDENTPNIIPTKKARSSRQAFSIFSLISFNYGVGFGVGVGVGALAAASSAVFGVPAMTQRVSISIYCWPSSLVGGIWRMTLPVLGSLPSWPVISRSSRLFGSAAAMTGALSPEFSISSKEVIR